LLRPNYLKQAAQACEGVCELLSKCSSDDHDSLRGALRKSTVHLIWPLEQRQTPQRSTVKESETSWKLRSLAAQYIANAHLFVHFFNFCHLVAYSLAPQIKKVKKK